MNADQNKSNRAAATDAPRSDKPLVDQPTRNLLLSAAGEVGGDLFDLLSPAARTEEQAIVVSSETALLGVAAACHFFTIRYAREVPALSLAIEIAHAYRARQFKVINADAGSDQAEWIDQYFKTQSIRALAIVLGTLHMFAERPEQMCWELSRALAQRFRLNNLRGQVHFSEARALTRSRRCSGGEAPEAVRGRKYGDALVAAERVQIVIA